MQGNQQLIILHDNEEYRYSTWINGEFTNQWTSFDGTEESQLDWCIKHFKLMGNINPVLICVYISNIGPGNVFKMHRG